MSATLEVRVVRTEDEGALLAALAERCGRSASAVESEWRWASAANPAGQRAVLALAGGHVVGHHAAVPRRVWMGREVVFACVSGCFARRAAPQALQRDSLHARLGRALSDAHAAAGGDLVYYSFQGGFNEPAAWRVENGLLDTEVVRNLTPLVRALRPGDGEPAAAVERIERFDHQAQWLWDRIAGSIGAGTIRDAAFLNWRFVERPGVTYELLGTRDAQGILRGFVALRVGEFAGRRAAWMVDWVVPVEERDVAERLLAAALVGARSRGAAELALVLPEWSPWSAWFQRAGFRVHPSPLFLAARCFARKYDEVWLRDHWWFTLADGQDL